MSEAPAMTGRLRGDIELLRGAENLLFDRSSGRYFQISREQISILPYLDRSRPVAELYLKLQQDGIDISRPELEKLLLFLRHNLLLVPEQDSVEQLHHQQVDQLRRTRFARYCNQIFFFRLPPWRPEKFLRRHGGILQIFTHRYVVLTLTLLATWGYLGILRNLPEIHRIFLDSLAWANLVKYFGVIVFLKLLHEVAHSLAAFHFNCPVRGVGLGFMFFYPRLYTDVTDSYRLPRHQRMLIDGAGLIAEILAGGLAALLWPYLAPGAAQATMFYIFTVSVISTVLVNGNPGIRYDGYYLLCDLCRHNNLMSHAMTYLHQLWRRFLHLGELPHPRHPIFLATFGLYAWCYRLFLYSSIIAVIYLKFTKVIAVLLILVEFYALIWQPLNREIRALYFLGRARGQRGAFYLGILCISAAVALVLGLPFPGHLVLPGEIVAPEIRSCRTTEAGYLSTILPPIPQKVKPHEVIYRLTSPQLEQQLAQAQARIKFYQLLYQQQILSGDTLPEARLTAQKIRAVKLTSEHLLRRAQKLTERATTSSYFVPQLPAPTPGAFLPPGTVLGQLHAPRTLVRAYATDEELGALELRTQVQVRYLDQLSSIPGHIVRISPVPQELTSSVLLQNYGGPIPIKVAAPPASGVCNAFPLYPVEIAISPENPAGWGRQVQVAIPRTYRLFDLLKKWALAAWHQEF